MTFGLGAGPLGDASLSDEAAERLVGRALELGVTVFDTAPGYGSSEVRLGRALAGQRDRATLITKGGYGVEGIPDWTCEVLTRGVEQSLRRLQTDRLDVFLLHSCGPEQLEAYLEPLHAAKRAGKVLAFGYSGDGAALSRALDLGYEVIETSVNLVDQAALEHQVPCAVAQGVRVIAKRALANAPWGFAQRPSRFDAGVYWDRWQALALSNAGLDWSEVAVRFSAFCPGVSVALAGTRSVERLEQLVRWVGQGPLPSALSGALRERFVAVGPAWPGMI
jgi:aryl-alcohol dehydrogenase-like predicted oxidoreductase